MTNEEMREIDFKSAVHAFMEHIITPRSTHAYGHQHYVSAVKNEHDRLWFEIAQRSGHLTKEARQNILYTWALPIFASEKKHLVKRAVGKVCRAANISPLSL